MTDTLKGKRIAILVAEGFEQIEMTAPRNALKDAGAKTEIISPDSSEVKGWKHHEPADAFKVDVQLEDADADEYDALLLSGGVMNPDTLRKLPEAVEFVRAFFEAGKPVAAICHGPQILIEADVVRGRTLTSYPSIKTDLANAGAHWVDEQVVTDQGLVTSRSPDDLPYFNEKMVEEFAEGAHAGQHA
jgi:protease I